MKVKASEEPCLRQGSESLPQVWLYRIIFNIVYKKYRSVRSFMLDNACINAYNHTRIHKCMDAKSGYAIMHRKNACRRKKDAEQKSIFK